MVIIISGEKTILFYLKGYRNPAPGAEAAGNDILKEIIKQNKYLIIIVSDRNSGPIKQKIIKKSCINMFHYHLMSQFLTSSLIIFLQERLIKKLVKIYSPDVIHIQGYSGYYPTPPKNTTSILTLHDDPYMTIYDKDRIDILKFIEFLWYEISKLIRIRAIKKFSFFHAMSSTIKTNLHALKIPLERIFLIFNGVNEKRNKTNNNSIDKKFKITPKRRVKLILMMGVIEYRKGTYDVSASFRHLPLNYHLLITGKPAPLIGIAYKSRVLNIDRKRIHFLGYLPKEDLEAVIKITDVYVSASYFEACQLAPLEALSMGKKVVTSVSGATLDFFPRSYPYLVIDRKPNIFANIIKQAVEKENEERLSLITHLVNWSDVGEKMNLAYKSIMGEYQE